MTHKILCIKVLKASSFSITSEYYTDEEIVLYVRRVGKISEAELRSELVKWGEV